MASDSDNDAGASVTSDSGSHGPPCRIAAVAVAQQRMFYHFYVSLILIKEYVFPLHLWICINIPQRQVGSAPHWYNVCVSFVKLTFSVCFFLLVQSTTATCRATTKLNWAMRTWSPLDLTLILLLLQMMRVMMRMMMMSQEWVGSPLLNISHLLIMTLELLLCTLHCLFWLVFESRRTTMPCW